MRNKQIRNYHKENKNLCQEIHSDTWIWSPQYVMPYGEGKMLPPPKLNMIPLTYFTNSQIFMGKFESKVWTNFRVVYSKKLVTDQISGRLFLNCWY